MVDCQLQAILVKVAALGLDPHKHLGKSIAQLQPYLHRLNHLYGSNVCGEGGEYETLTLDCPAFVMGRIVLDAFEVRWEKGDWALMSVLELHADTEALSYGAHGLQERVTHAVFKIFFRAS